MGWVTFKQINSYKLSHKCQKLEDLSDGILLFELISTM